MGPNLPNWTSNANARRQFIDGTNVLSVGHPNMTSIGRPKLNIAILVIDSGNGLWHQEEQVNHLWKWLTKNYCQLPGRCKGNY
ncbi:hypothetical protein OUZ56_024050 [Daphnia magna]|uniref:Uncharacterized protein n=1 Tax=Daphnia magna TaxID=35525 RepID=A0ABR0AZZ9_9CRUS|nr:hypothetical protein OUZ56_024050 [Daphnia magna]